MKIDITLKITSEILENQAKNVDPTLRGHLGTHFDVMNKSFPLDYTARKAVVFDVSDVKDRDIDIADVDTDRIAGDMFVAFYTDYYETVPYGSREYFKNHPQLSFALIDLLLDRGVSVIGVDFAGVRRGAEHTPTDQKCADKNVFVVENLRNLNLLLDAEDVTIYTYPMSLEGVSGLPCRVIAEIKNND